MISSTLGIWTYTITDHYFHWILSCSVNFVTPVVFPVKHDKGNERVILDRVHPSDSTQPQIHHRHHTRTHTHTHTLHPTWTPFRLNNYVLSFPCLCTYHLSPHVDHTFNTKCMISSHGSPINSLLVHCSYFTMKTMSQRPIRWFSEALDLFFQTDEEEIEV